MLDAAADGGDSWGASELGGRFGPYFALDVLAAGGVAVGGAAAGGAAGSPPAGWSAVADLADPSTGAFARRADAVRSALAAGQGRSASAVDERVAVSVAQLGLCARLVAPALGLAVATGRPPVLVLELLYWQDQLGGPFPLALGGLPAAVPSAVVPPAAVTPGTVPPGTVPPGTVALAADGAGPDGAGLAAVAEADLLASGLVAGVLLPVVLPLVAAIERDHSVSTKILWGNVASGLAGAAKMIGLAEPGLAGRAWGVVDALCAGDGPLRGAGARVTAGRFRRRSCCLLYRLALGAVGARGVPARNALCEDCVLTPG